MNDKKKLSVFVNGCIVGALIPVLFFAIARQDWSMVAFTSTIAALNFSLGVVL